MNFEVQFEQHQYHSFIYCVQVHSQRDDNDNGKSFFPSRMGNIGLYRGVHIETCGNGNDNDI